MKPQDVLPEGADEAVFNGVTVRKGSVGAFLASAQAWLDPALSADARDAAQRDITELIPGLRALGLFEVFQLRNPALRAFVEARP